MAVTKRYPAQIVIVASEEAANYIKTEADVEEVSGASVARDLIDYGRSVREEAKRTGYEPAALLDVLRRVPPAA